MAKSMRSKVKRSFRHIKRETGVYAATAAARLNRLSAKTIAPKTNETEEEIETGDMPGSSWLSALSLMDTQSITSESLEALGSFAFRHTYHNNDRFESLTFLPILASSAADTTMELDGEPAKAVSTHGPRHSRREEWRKSKGLTARPERNSTNKQGGLGARRKAGRSHRRR